MTTPTPFTIDVPQRDLDDLRDRLARTRWADDIANSAWTYGVESGWLRSMVSWWLDAYDWRATETRMNEWSHSRVELDGIPIHFARVRGVGPDPMPLVLTHGWPWTFWDFEQMVGPLTDPAAHGGDPADAFDVVVPSLPGYGFSVPLRTPGVNVRRVAALWVQLMTDVLGHDRFGAHGGDWGAIVTSELAHAHAPVLIGAHLSLPVIPGVSRRELGPEAFAADETWMLDRMAEAERLIRSHVTVHTHDPQTLAYALADSPVGTAAWLWERRRAWSDCGGDVESVFDRDFLCTLSSTYWLTGSITSSLRLYFEHFNGGWPRIHDRNPALECPTAFSIFPKELVLLPRSVAAAHSDLRQWTVHERGGHFGAAERPDALVDDLRRFFRPLR
ncbi:MAG: epoxide hydrolase family protein [Acidimicrobiales bacterium]